ncbi:hypothetical protein CFOL_v3_33397, partial [Cephalotus follicularis]
LLVITQVCSDWGSDADKPLD